jgi:hypothetical protein
MSDFDVEVEVLGDINNGYRLKVSVLDLGMYMFGWTARRSDKDKSGWWVQQQAFRVGSGWKQTPEFNKAFSLWQVIESKCIEAVTYYEANPPERVTDDMMTDEALDKGLDEAFKKLEGMDL